MQQNWLYTAPMVAVIVANVWRGTAFSMLVYDAALSDVPPELLARFGKPAPVMTLHLTPGRKLARADAATVLASIDRQGFYLQMPPGTVEPPAMTTQRDE